MISVIMSTYNDQHFVHLSIESILKQSYTDFEFLILDDFSSDSTLEVLKEYELKDERIKVFKNSKNIGLTKSLNKLIKLSNYNYIARQDSDDVSLPNRFKVQLDYMKLKKISVSTSLAKLKNSKQIRPKLSHLLPQKTIIKIKNPFVHGTMIIEKSVLEEVNLYDENFYYAQDYKLFYDLVKKGVKIGVIKKPLYILNTKDNISSKNKKQQAYYAECVKKEITPDTKYK